MRITDETALFALRKMLRLNFAHASMCIVFG